MGSGNSLEKSQALVKKALQEKYTVLYLNLHYLLLSTASSVPLGVANNLTRLSITLTTVPKKLSKTSKCLKAGIMDLFKCYTVSLNTYSTIYCLKENLIAKFKTILDKN
jgi:hypothetical protein